MIPFLLIFKMSYLCDVGFRLNASSVAYASTTSTLCKSSDVLTMHKSKSRHFRLRKCDLRRADSASMFSDPSTLYSVVENTHWLSDKLCFSASLCWTSHSVSLQKIRSSGLGGGASFSLFNVWRKFRYACPARCEIVNASSFLYISSPRTVVEPAVVEISQQYPKQFGSWCRVSSATSRSSDKNCVIF